jgi:VWFA-related protein
VLIVVDHEQIGAADGKAAIDAASRFLDRLGPLDRVGVVTLPNGRIEVDLTTNHRRVRQALSTITGKATRRNLFYNLSLDEAMIIREERLEPAAADRMRTGEILDRECRFAAADSACRANVESEALLIAREAEAATRATLQSLAGLFEGLAPIDGPKTVLFLSQSLVRFEDTHLDFEDVARAAARARAQLFVIQLHRAAVDALARNTPPERTNDGARLLGGLQDLAGATGGELFRLSGASDPVFTRIADQMSAYYLVGFEPRRDERDGKAHRIEITTRRRDVTIHVRPTFVLDDPDRLPPAPSQAVTMLRDRVAYQDLTLRATAYAFRDPDPKHLKIVVAVETAEPTPPLVQAAFSLVDVAGARAAEWTEAGANVVRRPLLTAAAVPPGEYRLRVAAIDALGRRGAVEHEFVAALTDAAPFVLAPLMLGWNEAGAFRPRLLFDAASPSAVAYLEMYGGPPPGNAMGIVFEIAERPDGPAIATSDAKLMASSDADRRVATGELPLAALAPGDYVVRAIVSVNGAPVGRVSRTLRRQ